MREPCPRCGADRPPVGACPDCGFEPDHPGVLGAYRAAGPVLADNPRLFLVYLAPVLVFVGAQALLLATGAADPQATGPGAAVAGLAALFLQAAWYLVALGATVPAAAGTGGVGLPGGGVVRGGLAGAAIVTAPWVAIAALLAAGLEGAPGALGLMAAVLLVIGAVFAAGRAVGLPVEAALNDPDGLALIRRGSDRARENGGLGLVFLALLVLAALPLATGVVSALGLADLGPWQLLALAGLVAWPAGAWIGTAMAIGLVGRTEGPTASFACPVCGREATVEEGRAACGCGLEGPYYEADDAPGPA